MPPFERIQIPAEVLEQILAQAGAEAPRECCGLLAGVLEKDRGCVRVRFPIRNDFAGEKEYLTNGRDLLDAIRTMRIEGLEPLAIYHSHPASDPLPSIRDLENNTWGELVVHLIVSLAGPQPVIRAWWLGEKSYREAEVITTLGT